MIFCSAANAEFDHRADVLLFINHRELNQDGLSEYDAVTDAGFGLGDDLSFTYRALRLEARPELRGEYGYGVGLPVTDPAFSTIRSPDRALDLGFEVGSGDKYELYFEFEKLFFSIQTNSLEIAAGRRPIGLGVLKYLPVWNKFTVLLPTHTGPPFIYNPDNAIIRYQFRSMALSAMDIEGAHPEDAVRLGQINFYGDSLELQSLFGEWWQYTVAGLAASTDLAGLTLRAETLWFGLDPYDEQYGFQGGYGLEYASSENVSWLIEGLHLDRGVDHPDFYKLQAPSRFSPLRAEDYLLGLMEYRFLPEWKWLTGPFVNLLDGSLLYLNDLRWSVTDDSEFTAQIKTPIGEERTEFSSKTFVFPDGSYLGYPYIFNLILRTYF